jgi:hypothetical protein
VKTVFNVIFAKILACLSTRIATPNSVNRKHCYRHSPC